MTSTSGSQPQANSGPAPEGESADHLPWEYRVACLEASVATGPMKGVMPSHLRVYVRKRGGEFEHKPEDRR